MKKTTFVMPISNTDKWEGQLHVTVSGDSQDYEIHEVEFEDRHGVMVDISELVFNWCRSLYKHVCDAASEFLADLKYTEESDYTMAQQDAI